MAFVLTAIVCAVAFYYAFSREFLSKCPNCNAQTSEQVNICKKCNTPKYQDFLKRLSMAVGIVTACLLCVKVGAFVRASDNFFLALLGEVFFYISWVMLVVMGPLALIAVYMFAQEVYRIKHPSKADIEKEKKKEARQKAKEEAKIKEQEKLASYPEDLESLLDLRNNKKISEKHLVMLLESKSKPYFKKLNPELQMRAIKVLSKATKTLKIAEKIASVVESDENLLKLIKETYISVNFSLKAYKKIKDKSLCIDLLKTDLHWELTDMILEQIQDKDQAEKIILDSKYNKSSARISLLARYGDQELARKIIKQKRGIDFVFMALTYIEELDEQIEAMKDLCCKNTRTTATSFIMEDKYPSAYSSMQELAYVGHLQEVPYHCDADFIAHILDLFEFEDDSGYTFNDELRLMIKYDSEYKDDGYWKTSTYLNIERRTEDRYTWSISYDSVED